MVEILDSYQKASQNIVDYLSEDPKILLINAFLFRLVAASATYSNLHLFDYKTFDHVLITDIIPNIFEEFKLASPYPSSKDLLATSHFITELITGYGTTWVAVASLSYQHALKTNFRDDFNMIYWQRYIRAESSTDPLELTLLAVDPNQLVRDKATYRLKTPNTSV